MRRSSCTAVASLSHLRSKRRDARAYRGGLAHDEWTHRLMALQRALSRPLLAPGAFVEGCKCTYMTLGTSTGAVGRATSPVALCRDGTPSCCSGSPSDMQSSSSSSSICSSSQACAWSADEFESRTLSRDTGLLRGPCSWLELLRVVVAELRGLWRSDESQLNPVTVVSTARGEALVIRPALSMSWLSCWKLLCST
jgi:hypothetical protein